MNKIFFDMDWTLYSFENWQYRLSKLEKKVQSNAKKILKIIEWDYYNEKFEEIIKKYWENFSIAYEELYGIKKEDYFNKTWDIIPNDFIIDDRNVLKLFNYLKNKWYLIYIVSESPKIWINRVLNYLKIDNLISWIYSWQWDERKSNWLLYKKIVKEQWSWFFMIWDQLESDIISAKNNWFNTIYINTKWEKTSESKYNIKELSELYFII